MRRQDEIKNQKKREHLQQHKILEEEERGWAGQHGQHPETEEEEKYRPIPERPDLANPKK